ncbi:MAG TPA: hypothetical protein VGI88_01490 [Verrucomicrobiae bacterium]
MRAVVVNQNALAALTIAVLQSERVQNLKRLSWSATLQPPRGALAHAEAVLKA